MYISLWLFIALAYTIKIPPLGQIDLLDFKTT